MKKALVREIRDLILKVELSIHTGDKENAEKDIGKLRDMMRRYDEDTFKR